MLARADFTKALRGFDPRTLHAHPELAASVRQRLADLAHAPAARGAVVAPTSFATLGEGKHGTFR